MDIKAVIEGVRKLPLTPQILPKLQNLIRDPGAEIEDIVTLIKMDAPLVAQVVRLSNSVFFGSALPSQSVEDAVKRLGFNEVFRVVNLIVSQQVLGQEMTCYGKGQGELFQESLYCGVIMEKLAIRAKLDPSNAYTIGLLHPIGKVVINQYLLTRSMILYDGSSGQSLTQEDEKALLGFNNAEVAGALLRGWNFPEELTMPIEHQYNPETAAPHDKLAQLLRLSRVVGQRLEMKIIDGGGFDYMPEEQLLSELRLDKDSFQKAVMDSEESLGVMTALMAAV